MGWLRLGTVLNRHSWLSLRWATCNYILGRGESKHEAF